MTMRVKVPVDFDYLEWHGWEAFAILDKGIRIGVRGSYRSAELESVEEHPRTPQGAVTFLVDEVIDPVTSAPS